MTTELAKLEAATTALAEAKTLSEVKKIIDIAEAARTYAKAAKMGLAAQNYGAEIKLHGQRKAGEFLKLMEKNKGAQGNPNGRGAPIVRSSATTAQAPTLADIGITKDESSLWQKVADIPEDVIAQHIAEIEKEEDPKAELTIASVLHRATQHKREQHVTNPPPPIVGKYRVIYADPPWKYGNTQPDYHGEQADHYTLMSLADICAMPIKEVAEDNAVLFLWVTSPILEEAFQVVSAWWLCLYMLFR